MQSSDENSVCLSNACIVTKRKKDLSRFLYHTPSFPRKRLVGGDDPFYLKFCVNRPQLDFEPIFAHSASAVTSNEKSSINTNRKSTMRFPMSLR